MIEIFKIWNTKEGVVIVTEEAKDEKTFKNSWHETWLKVS